MTLKKRDPVLQGKYLDGQRNTETEKADGGSKRAEKRKRHHIENHESSREILGIFCHWGGSLDPL